MTGCKAVNALSKKMIVSTSREGIKEIVEFSKGQFINYDTKKSSDNGVEVLFYPDETIFETVKIDSERLEKLIQEFSFLCSGLTFLFIDENKEYSKEYFSANGLYDYIEYLNGEKEFLTKPIYFSEKEGKFKIEVIFGYNNSYSSTVKLYTNNIPQEKGTHLTGFKTAFTSSLNAFAREKKLLKEKDKNLQGSDFEEGQLLVINFKMIDPVFKGQNKEELSSSEGRSYVQKFTSKALKELFVTNEKEIKKIVDKALNARKAREAAKRARESIRKGNKDKGLKAKLAISNKFFDCRSKDPKEKNLLLVEGLSAGGSALEARNVKTDCIYMLRGKVLSALKHPIEKILNNQEYSDIINIIGAGFGNDKFDINKMNFDKIVITADQDSDGQAIELLLITFFYSYMRPLVTNGKLYRAVTPLYIITTKDKKYYLYSETEFSDWKQTVTVPYNVMHCKG